MRFLEDAIASGVRSPDERDGRVYGWLFGTVTDVDKDTKFVKARIGRQEDNESTHWLVPLFPGAIESVPHTDDPVAVFFMDGDPHRGAYLYFPQSTTKERPTEAMVLGNTLVGMINYLVTQFNQLRTDFNTFASTFSAHTHIVAGVSTGSASVTSAVPSATQPSTSANTAPKGQAADGSTVADVSSASKVLSGRALVGI